MPRGCPAGTVETLIIFVDADTATGGDEDVAVVDEIIEVRQGAVHDIRDARHLLSGRHLPASRIRMAAVENQRCSSLVASHRWLPVSQTGRQFAAGGVQLRVFARLPAARKRSSHDHVPDHVPAYDSHPSRWRSGSCPMFPASALIRATRRRPYLCCRETSSTRAEAATSSSTFPSSRRSFSALSSVWSSIFSGEGPWHLRAAANTGRQALWLEQRLHLH